MASGKDGSRCLVQQRGNGAAPLPPLRSVPTAQTSSIALGPAETGGNGICDDNGGLELHHASALEDAEAAGPLDAVLDELGGDPFFSGSMWAAARKAFFRCLKKTKL